MGLVGLAGNTVIVEVDISDGLPHYNLLGLPDAALTESRDRVRAALTNSGESWPNRKVTVSRKLSLGLRQQRECRVGIVLLDRQRRCGDLQQAGGRDA